MIAWLNYLSERIFQIEYPGATKLRHHGLKFLRMKVYWTKTAFDTLKMIVKELETRWLELVGMVHNLRYTENVVFSKQV